MRCIGEPRQPPVGRFQQDHSLPSTPFEAPFERLLVVDRFLHHDLGPPARKAPVVVQARVADDRVLVMKPPTYMRTGVDPQRRESSRSRGWTCSQSSILTLSSGVADGPGLSMKTLHHVSPRFAATLECPRSPVLSSGGDPLGNRPNMLKRLP